MKKLFLLTLTLFLFGCDLVEKDTRLICDCIYEYDSFEQTRMECRDDPSYKNAALVFNESNEKFVFNKFSGGGNLRSEFTKDEIVRMETTDFDDALSIQNIAKVVF